MRTIVHARPGPDVPREVVRHGALLRTLRSSGYETRDGLYRVELVRVRQLCAARHGLRITPAHRERADAAWRRAVREQAGQRWEREGDRTDAIVSEAARYAGMPVPFLRLVRLGERGAYCQGGQYHEHDAWRVWDVRADAQLPEQPSASSLRDAVGVLLRHAPGHRAT